MADKKNASLQKYSNAHVVRTKIQARGYYSEIITSVDYGNPIQSDDLGGCSKKTNYIWQVTTERHAPTIKKFMPHAKVVELKDAERWIAFDEDDSFVSSVNKLKF